MVIAKRADARAADYVPTIAEETESSNYKYCSIGAKSITAMSRQLPAAADQVGMLRVTRRQGGGGRVRPGAVGRGSHPRHSIAN